jgi:hypothetical protein
MKNNAVWIIEKFTRNNWKPWDMRFSRKESIKEINLINRWNEKYRAIKYRPVLAGKD